MKLLKDKKSSKAAAELLSTYPDLKNDEILNFTIELFSSQADCAPQLAMFFAKIQHPKMCQLVLIYAFDAVNLQMEVTRQAAPLAA